MKKAVILFLVLSIATGVFAQFKDSGSSVPGIKNSFIQPSPRGLLNGIMDPTRLSMSQSYSMSYSSAGGGGFMQGMYLNNMSYRLSPKMMLGLQMGYLHTPYNSYSGGFNQSVNGDIIGGASLTYRPSKNVALSLGFSRMPMYYSPYSFNPYGLNPGYLYLQDPIIDDPANYRPKEYSPGIDGN